MDKTSAPLRRDLMDRVAERSNASRRVLDAIASVPRELFLPGVDLDRVYADGPYSIGYGQTISQPTIVAVMTEALQLQPTSRVLEIGTGCGYQTAILARLAGEVFTIEVVKELADSARERLEGLGIENVHCKLGDGYEGWPEQAPFDRIIATAAPLELPPTLTDQLGEAGILVAPVGPRFAQDLVAVRRVGGSLRSETICGVRFVPMVPSDGGM